MANETTMAMSVEVDGAELNTDISEATMDNSVVTVDVTALADEETDNRAGTKQTSASVTFLCSDDFANTIAEGDIITLTVDSEASVTANVLVTNVAVGGGVNQPRTARITFVGTKET